MSDKVKKKAKEGRPMSSDIFRKTQHHLNVVQIFIKGTGYLLENKNYDLSEVAERMSEVCKTSIMEDVNSLVSDYFCQLQ